MSSKSLIISSLFSTLQLNINSEFKTISTVPPTIAWGGSRGVFVLGHTGSAFTTQIDFFDITTSGNAADFGDLTQSRNPNPVGNSARCCFGGGVAPLRTLCWQ